MTVPGLPTTPVTIRSRCWPATSFSSASRRSRRHACRAEPSCGRRGTTGCGGCRRVGASESALTAYRVAIDGLLDWARGTGRSVFEEATIVDHLAASSRDPGPPRRPTTAASGSCAASSTGSAGAAACRTRSSSSSRRRSRSRKRTGERGGVRAPAYRGRAPASAPRRASPSATGSSCSRSSRRACAGRN